MQTTFAQRLTQACDDSKVVPEFGKGRQVSIARRMKVSQEAVRKWFTGEAVPKQDKMKELADFLEVDEAWLALGLKPELDRTEKLSKRRVVEGAVHMVAGMIMIEGGNVAFPSEKDPRREYIDLYAIMRGTQMALHVSVATELSAGRFEMVVPRNYADVRCIGFIPVAGGNFHLLELDIEKLEEHKKKKAGDWAIVVGRVEGRYYTGEDEWHRFKHIGDIL